MLDEVRHERVDADGARRAEDRDLLGGKVVDPQHARSHRVVDVVVDVRDAVHEPDDLALERRGLAGAAGVAQDAVAHRLGQVERLEDVDHAQRVLVVAEAAAEALAAGAIEHVLADVPERRVPDVVAEPDRLRQVLVEPERAGDRPADPVTSSVWVSRVR